MPRQRQCQNIGTEMLIVLEDIICIRIVSPVLLLTINIYSLLVMCVSG